MLIETTARKKITNLKEIYDGKNLLIKEFRNLDLSNLDLSSIPIEQWEDCIFYNTSFKNTGIKFIPNKLGLLKREECERFKSNNYFLVKKGMHFCDFSDNDLTYLKRSDFGIDETSYKINIGEDSEIGTYGCNFENTGINFLKTLRNLKLDESYGLYTFDSDYWKFEYGTVNWPDFIDIDTIIKNPFLEVPSFRIMNAIYYYIREMDEKYKIIKRTSRDLFSDII